MNTAYRTLFAGMLAIVFCGTAIAHDRHHGGWSGGVSVAVVPGGDLYWTGRLDYGADIAYPVRRVFVPRGYRVLMCHHPSHRRPVVVRNGHRHGTRHRVIHVYH